jgi:hypothetical protein
MALRGSLDDLAVVDLIQFVHQARQTGALQLKGAGQEARLFYRQGALVDARSGPHAGLEVLIRVIDWTSGEFEFLAGQESSETTIDMDLHRAVMMAVKLRDERKAEEERQQAERAAQAKARAHAGNGHAASEQLKQLVSMGDFLLHLCLLDGEGRLLGEAHGSRAENRDLAPVVAAMAEFARTYPRGEMKRMFIEDEAGTVVLAGVPGERLLLAIADRGAPLGAVSVTLGKLLAKLDANGGAASAR